MTFSLSGMYRQNKPLGLGSSVCFLRFGHVWTLCPWMSCSNSVVRLRRRRRLRRSIHRPSVSSCLARSLLTSFDTTEPQHSVFTSTEATSSTVSMLSVFGNAQASLSAPPWPNFAVATAQQPAPQPCSAALRPVFTASQPVPQPCSAAPRPTFAASQPGLAAVRRSLVSQRSLVHAPLPTAELSPLSPAWAPQFLPGPALPTGPVAVLPPLPAEPAHPSPMSLEEEELLLEVEEGQESTKL